MHQYRLGVTGWKVAGETQLECRVQFWAPLYMNSMGIPEQAQQKATKATKGLEPVIRGEAERVRALLGEGKTQGNLINMQNTLMEGIKKMEFDS